MGWIARKFDKWAEEKQRTELEAFVSNLRSMDSVEIGHVLAIATNLRHKLEADGHNLLDPINYSIVKPNFPFFLSTTIGRLQKANMPQEAAGMMIWIHTFRSAIRLELRGLGRNMWRELSRGMPHVSDSSVLYEEFTGNTLNTTGSDNFPEGLSPEPK